MHGFHGEHSKVVRPNIQFQKKELLLRIELLMLTEMDAPGGFFRGFKAHLCGILFACGAR